MEFGIKREQLIMDNVFTKIKSVSVRQKKLQIGLFKVGQTPTPVVGVFTEQPVAYSQKTHGTFFQNE
jgi:hypothetical protein